MASPSEKLAESLAALKKLQDHGITALRSDQLTELIGSAYSRMDSFSKL